MYSLHTNTHIGEFYETAFHGDNRATAIVDKVDLEQLFCDGKMVSLSDATDFSTLVSCLDLFLLVVYICQLVSVSVPCLYLSACAFCCLSFSPHICPCHYNALLCLSIVDGMYCIVFSNGVGYVLYCVPNDFQCWNVCRECFSLPSIYPTKGSCIYLKKYR